MGLKRKESCLVVFDKNKEEIAKRFFLAAKKICENAEMVETPVAKVNGSEPPKNISTKMKEYDVNLLITTRSLSHTNSRRNASKKGARIASMPGITEEMIKRTLNADYKKIEEANKKLLGLLQGKKLRIVTKKGTDVTMDIGPCFIDSGIYIKKGDFGNLPAGEVGFAPKNANGTIIIDKTFAGVGKLRNDIKITVKNGFAEKIIGGKEAKKLSAILKKYNDKNVYNIAECAIGTNPKAKITGKTLEDEKVRGTVHIALGDNTSYPRGKIKAPMHLDGIIAQPTIFVDNKKIIDKGKIFKVILSRE
ncbi:MAG: aminopeptidase [Nanoarchaeota archaeon]